MAYSIFNSQLLVDNIFLPLEDFTNSLFFYLSINLNYLNNIFSLDYFFLTKTSNLLISWFNIFLLDNLHNYLICNINSYAWLFNNGNIYESILWNSYNHFFQLERDMYFLMAPSLAAKQIFLLVKINSYYYLYLIKFLKISFFFLFFINLLFYTRFNLKLLNWSNNVIISKFFLLFETEEELGSIDDGLFFIILFIYIFSGYFLLSYFFVNNYNISLMYISSSFIILTTFILLIPLSMFFDFGLTFTTYLRGVGSSTFLIVEIVFDFISILVVFSRFLSQNIRFLLIFSVYFELYEWIYNSSFLLLFNQLFSINLNTFFSYSYLDLTSFFYLIGISFFGVLNYLYYLIHLLILIFMQLVFYFLISFWLFFFFYTSFFLNKYEKFFFYKKYII